MEQPNAPIDFADLQFIDDLNQPPKIIKGITNLPQPKKLEVNQDIKVGNYPRGDDQPSQCGDSVYRITNCEHVTDSFQYALIASLVVT